MSCISFPKDFPSIETMMSVIRKTFEKSWKVELDIDDVNSWLENFNGSCFSKDDEQRLALWLFCNFSYYNEEEINHLCSILFKNFTHKLILDNELTGSDDVIKCINKIYFTSIGRASESGGLILYHFRQEANLSTDRFFFPTSIDSTEDDIIVCIDDVFLSGGTAARFFYQSTGKFKHKHLYYLTLFTSQEAINKLQGLGIDVIYCEKFDDRNKVFSESSLCFYKYPSLRDTARNLAECYGRKIEPDMPLGHKNGQYCFGLYYNIPNNSLPIFWSSSGWTPILLRKEKYQNVSQYKRQLDYFI